MADGKIVVQQQTGPSKSVDTSQLTTDAGVVQRERVSIGDDSDPNAFVSVSGLPLRSAGGLATRQVGYENEMDLLRAILVELRTLSTLVAIGMNVRDDPDTIRRDTFNQQIN